MPSISEATRGQTGRRRRRIAAGFGLLLAGALFVAIGAAGAANAGSIRNGALIGGLAVLCCLVLLADRASLGERERSVAAIGAAIGLVGLFIFWGLPADAGTPAAAALGAATVYGFGAAVMLGAVLASTARGSSDRASSDAVVWKRSGTAEPSEATADGRGVDDELSFPLEDD